MTDPQTPPRGRSALLLGATGLVGSRCLARLLADPAYARVRVLGRRCPADVHPKLECDRIDFDRLEDEPVSFAADDVFCCLGTTMAKAGSEEDFRRVDLEYPVRAAARAAEEGADQFLVVSSLGADPDSRIFYSRVKGEMEAAVKRLPFRAVWILRPSLLLGSRAEARFGERVAAALSRPLAPLLVGPLRRYRPIPADDVAAAMLRLAALDGTGGVVESDGIAALARG